MSIRSVLTGCAFVVSITTIAQAEVQYVAPGFSFTSVECGTVYHLGMFINPGIKSLSSSGNPWITTVKANQACGQAANTCDQNKALVNAEIVRLSQEFQQLCAARQCVSQVVSNTTADCSVGSLETIGGETGFIDADDMANVAFGNDCLSTVSRVPGEPMPTVHYSPNAGYCMNHFDCGGGVWGAGFASISCTFGGGVHLADFTCD